MSPAQAYTDRKSAILNKGWFVAILFFLATIAYLWPQATHMATPYMVFGLYFLVLFLDRSRTSQRLLDRRNLLFLLLFAAFTAFQALAAGYYGYYAAILYGLYFVYYLLKEAGLAAWLSSLLHR